MQHSQRSIPSLDGLRAFSIGLVLIGHAVCTRGFPEWANFPDHFSRIANLGVRIFFVISGFLISTLLMKELSSTGKISLPRFYLRRTIRIFPSVYVYILALAVLASLGIAKLAPGDLLHAVLYTTNYYPGHSWWVGHLWSLAVEEQFYLVWPAVVLFAGLRRSMFVAGAALLLCPLARVCIWFLLPELRNTIGLAFPTIADALATGCLLAGFRYSQINVPWYQAFLRSKLFIVVPAILFSAALYPWGRLRMAVLETVINLGSALIIDFAVQQPHGRIGKLLNCRLACFIGVCSYSLYVWQQPFLNRYFVSFPTSFPVNFLFAITIALTVYYVLEAPLLRLRPRLERLCLRPRSGPEFTSHSGQLPVYQQEVSAQGR